MGIELVLSKLKMLGYQAETVDTQTILCTKEGEARLYRLSDNKPLAYNLYNQVIPYRKMGIAKVRVGDKWGLVRFSLVELVKPIYSSVSIYDNQIILLDDGSNVGLYGINLTQLTPAIYRNVSYVFKTATGKYVASLVDKENTMVSYLIDGDQCNRIAYDLGIVCSKCPEGTLLGDRRIHLDCDKCIEWCLYDIETKGYTTISRFEVIVSGEIEIEESNGDTRILPLMKEIHESK